ncbi:glucosaminylphosphatidylinositol acyltransferase [Nematocida sp. AWRm80]|nr:glucosaminylphosphatidylinositol acyltransferase [Nematocida sp. AWRm80]
MNNHKEMIRVLQGSSVNRIELIHSTTSPIYWLVIADYFRITNFWVLFIGQCLIHYLITITSTSTIGNTLGCISLGLFLHKVLRIQLSTRKENKTPNTTSNTNIIDTNSTKDVNDKRLSKYTEDKKISESTKDKKKVLNLDGKPGVRCSTEEEARMVINGLRFIVCSLVCISIFACDFALYPEHKMKSKYFGISLMDFGVVVFMFNAGMIAAVSHRFRAQKSLYMLAMGLIRLGVLSSGYHSDPTEYGTHLNFYFVYLLSELYSILFRYKNSILMAICMLLGHEIYLHSNGIVEYILFSERTNLFNSNREGLISVLPYAGVLFLGKSIGRIVFKKKQTHLRKSAELMAVFVSLLAVHFISGIFLGPSRRLCSLSFISFSCASVIFPMGLFYLVSSFYALPSISPLKEISSLMGPLFLLSNVYVLIGNLLFDWRRYSTLESHLVNILYLILLFVPPVYLALRKSVKV